MGFVYFFMSPDCEAVKIGFSANPYMRLANYKTAHYQDVAWEDIYPGTPADEIALHKFLEPHRIQREWFRLNDAVRDFFSKTYKMRGSP